MKRGCQVKVLNDGADVKASVREAICEIFDRLCYEAEKHKETVDFETLKIKCDHVFPNELRVEGTVDSNSLPLSYKEIMMMYLDERYREKKNSEIFQNEEGE